MYVKLITLQHFGGACFNGHLKMCKLLHSIDKNLHKISCNGHKPSRVAKMQGHFHIMRWMKSLSH